MPAAADLVAYLDPLVAETAGVTLFDEPLPESVNNGVHVAHYNGEPGDYVMGASLSASSMEVAYVQVMVRNEDRATAETKAYAYHALLENLGPVTINGRLYHDVASIDGEPHFLSRDGNDRARYVCSYRVEKGRG